MTAQRDDNCYLWDMLAAARAVESFVHGRTDADYLADLMLRLLDSSSRLGSPPPRIRSCHGCQPGTHREAAG